MKVHGLWLNPKVPQPSPHPLLADSIRQPSNVQPLRVFHGSCKSEGINTREQRQTWAKKNKNIDLGSTRTNCYRKLFLCYALNIPTPLKVPMPQNVWLPQSVASQSVSLSVAFPKCEILSKSVCVCVPKCDFCILWLSQGVVLSYCFKEYGFSKVWFSFLFFKVSCQIQKNHLIFCALF